VFRLHLVVNFICLSSSVFSLQAVSFSGPRFIVLAPGLLFCCMRSNLIRHIRPLNQTYPAKPGHIRLEAGHIWSPCFNWFKSSEFQVLLPIHLSLGNFHNNKPCRSSRRGTTTIQHRASLITSVLCSTTCSWPHGPLNIEQYLHRNTHVLQGCDSLGGGR
jgi:hypothetical protein